MFYIAYCLKLLLNKIGYRYDTNDISSLNLSHDAEEAEELWDNFIRFTNYVPVLVTDNNYPTDKAGRLDGLQRIRWKMVVDIGPESSGNAVYMCLLKNTSKDVNVKKISLMPGTKDTADTFVSTTNVLYARKLEQDSYFKLWLDHKKNIVAALNKLLAEKPLVPLLFIFDCGKESEEFRNQFTYSLFENALPKGTRIISLRGSFLDNIKNEINAFEASHEWHFIEEIRSDLTDVASAAKMYLNEEKSRYRGANLPSLTGVYTFSREDIANYGSCLELVYSGCESYAEDRLGLDIGASDGGELGEAFFKGGEATWLDIAEHRDVSFYDDKKYDDIIERLKKIIIENFPRVKTRTLRHGAGTGGTTLSKRLLWDLKDFTPCIRLKKYNDNTAKYLLEIYQKTGRPILLSIESGSSIISEEELNKLKKDVDASNGKMTVLLIKRTENTPKDTAASKEELEEKKKEEKEEKKHTLLTINDTMDSKCAMRFYNTFLPFAERRPYGNQRKEMLRKITGNVGYDSSNYTEQRSPFFYGFYAFQEEYMLFERLSNTVCSCSRQQKELLNNLALGTIFSQNICIGVPELCLILELDSDGQNIYALKEKIPPEISKLMVVRETGFRMCHKVIAEKILLMIHDENHKYDDVKYVVFKAAMMYIDTMSRLYDSSNEYVNDVLKELIIDRAYIDSEDRKTRFSVLVESIPIWSDKKTIFEHLIEKFPNNPHYYNHMARLLAAGDKKSGISSQYDKAVKLLKHAIEIAGDAKSIHETTLGCIYGQWINNDIKNECDLKKQGKLHSGYSEIITNIGMHYGLSVELFESARENAKATDSFSYFPQINMECAIISNLVRLDKDASLDELVKNNDVFGNWYHEHYTIASELYTRMKESIPDYDRLLTEAREKIKNISLNDFKDIDQRFTRYLDSNDPADRRRSRSLTYNVFHTNRSSRYSPKKGTYELAEKCALKNVFERDVSHINYDVETWLELFRKVKYFDASKAQQIIADYMPESYRKSYLLFLMTFIMHTKGIASTQSVNQQVIEANRLARLHGENTAREHDVYVGSDYGTDGCRIVPLSEAHRIGGKLLDLETFSGMITEVEQTHGNIYMDKLALDVTFIPNPISVANDENRTFSWEDIMSTVEFNLMFSYSGLRAWDVRKISEASN